MEILFNDLELIELMKDFYVLTGIKIAFFDASQNEILAYPKGENTFCHCMRKIPEFREKCKESDDNAFLKCRQTQKMHIFKCHMGLIEASVPLIEDGKIMGFMMLGRITDQKNKDELTKQILKLCRNYETNISIEEKIKDIKYRKETQIRAASKILDACTEYIKLKKFVHPSGESLLDAVERFVERHIAEDIPIERLCSEFQISRTQLYETLNPYINDGIASFIKHKRLEHAKKLLETTEMTVVEISNACGFADYNYFLRSFKRKYGLSTKQIRKKRVV